MPTVLVLDVSLSMIRSIPGQTGEEQVTYHQLAVQGINQFLDYLTATSKLEYVSLVSFLLFHLLDLKSLIKVNIEKLFRNELLSFAYLFIYFHIAFPVMLFEFSDTSRVF